MDLRTIMPSLSRLGNRKCSQSLGAGLEMRPRGKMDWSRSGEPCNWVGFQVIILLQLDTELTLDKTNKVYLVHRNNCS